MATKQHTTKPRRQPQAAKPSIRWADYEDDWRNRPKSAKAQRRLLRRALLEMDDEGIGLCWSYIIHAATQSAIRADLVELAIRRYTDQVRAKRGRKAVRP